VPYAIEIAVSASAELNAMKAYDHFHRGVSRRFGQILGGGRERGHRFDAGRTALRSAAGCSE
jgi:hypothetical protein